MGGGGGGSFIFARCGERCGAEGAAGAAGRSLALGGAGLNGRRGGGCLVAGVCAAASTAVELRPNRGAVVEEGDRLRGTGSCEPFPGGPEPRRKSITFDCLVDPPAAPIADPPLFRLLAGTVACFGEAARGDGPPEMDPDGGRLVGGLRVRKSNALPPLLSSFLNPITGEDEARGFACPSSRGGGAPRRNARAFKGPTSVDGIDSQVCRCGSKRKKIEGSII